MYKITTPDGVVYTREKPDFIRVHKNGCFLLTTREKAEGVAIHGTPYLFKDGAFVCEFDGGQAMDELIAENQALAAQLAETDEAAIELYEATLNMEAVNAEQDEAIIEIYETMEEMNHG